MSDERLRASREATLIQRRAADPLRSVTLRAAAGSGKTKVLVDRIVRLLLVKAPLKSVVALTFTRKAAVEIRERLRKRLGELARLDRADLTAELETLLGRPPDPDELSRAALIFEEILEDASGLLVGTIHTFCQTLLRRFADEAGLDPGFTVLENTDDLWDEALAALETDLADEPDAIADLAELAKDPNAARGQLRKIETARGALDRWCDRVAGAPTPPGAPRAGFLPALASDLAAHLFAGTSLEGLTDPSPEDLRAPAIAAIRDYASAGLETVVTTEGEAATAGFDRMITGRRETATALADALESGADVEDALVDLRALVYTKQGDVKVGNAGAKTTRETRRVALIEAAAPVGALLALGDLLVLHRRNRLWLRFGLRALDRYEGLKRRDRCLDFHDLERRAWRLVHDLDVGPWVLYRMDARLDHLLVDEFQDTNRTQWDVLRPFAEEFLSGSDEGACPRSAFFVGDVKQSIYGFRGARPAIFGEVAEWLQHMTGESGLTLPTNFRSLPAVVETVGEVFGAPPLSERLSPEEAAAAAQIPFRDDGPGCVHLLEPVEDHDAAAELAARIVTRIASEGRVTENGATRPARYGDILLLARSRTHLAPYEAALRRAGIPLVPAGRGALARSREVQDLLNLLRWFTFPADDAALACVLRSPLFGVPEGLFQEALARYLALGAGRGNLWRALRSEGRPAALAGIEAILSGWLNHVGQESVHRLLRRIYRDVGAPARFGTALGEQARYNLLRLHDLALDLERRPFPSLRAFVDEVERAALRQDQEEAVLPDTDLGRVRMMTIHGAKGLEAPFVLLADHAAPLGREDAEVILPRHDETGPLVTGLCAEHRRDDAGTALSAAAARARQDALREAAHLLYVGMTRARDELWILGAAPTKSKDAPSFARWLDEGPHGLETEPDDLPTASATPAMPGDASVSHDTARTWTPCGLTPPHPPPVPLVGRRRPARPDDLEAGPRGPPRRRRADRPRARPPSGRRSPTGRPGPRRRRPPGAAAGGRDRSRSARRESRPRRGPRRLRESRPRLDLPSLVGRRPLRGARDRAAGARYRRTGPTPPGRRRPPPAAPRRDRRDRLQDQSRRRGGSPRDGRTLPSPDGGLPHGAHRRAGRPPGPSVPAVHGDAGAGRSRSTRRARLIQGTTTAAPSNRPWRRSSSAAPASSRA